MCFCTDIRKYHNEHVNLPDTDQEDAGRLVDPQVEEVHLVEYHILQVYLVWDHNLTIHLLHNRQPVLEVLLELLYFHCNCSWNVVAVVPNQEV